MTSPGSRPTSAARRPRRLPQWVPRPTPPATTPPSAARPIWDAVTGVELERHEVGARAGALAWAPSGERLAVGLEGGEVALLDVRGPMVEGVCFRADGGSVNGLAWGAGGLLLASAGDLAVAISGGPAGRCLERFAVNTHAHRIAWAPSGGGVAASLLGDVIGLWDTRAALATGR